MNATATGSTSPRIVLWMAALLLAAGCGTDASPMTEALDATSTTHSAPGDVAEPAAQPDDDDPPPSTASASPDGLIEQVECPSNASCAEEITLNGRTYAVSCLAIDPAEVDTGAVLGDGWALGRALQANALFRAPDATIIALSVPEERSGCSPASLRSPWTFAFLGSADLSIVCSIGLFTPAEAIEEGCDR